MTSCCQRRRMRWSGATGAIARCKNTSTGYARKNRSGHAWRWTCGEKPKAKAVNKPSPHSIMHELDKPGVFTTVSRCWPPKGKSWPPGDCLPHYVVGVWRIQCLAQIEHKRISVYAQSANQSVQ